MPLPRRQAGVVPSSCPLEICSRDFLLLGSIPSEGPPAMAEVRVEGSKIMKFRKELLNFAAILKI